MTAHQEGNAVELTEKQRSLTPEHKEALALGRQEGAIVRAYLEKLEANQPQRGRKPNRDKLEARLDEINREMTEVPLASRLKLIQQAERIRATLAKLDRVVDITEAEEAFVRVAYNYANRKGITYKMFREVGVPAEVLRKAGFSRKTLVAAA